MEPLRLAGLFLANLFAAVVGTSVLTALTPVRSTFSVLLASEFVAAFAVGYLGYLILKSDTAKWVWIAGLLWFGQRAVALWMNQSTVRAITGSHGTFPLLHPGPDAQSVSDWITYTLIFLRTIFYSVGAFLCSRFARPAPLDP